MGFIGGAISAFQGNPTYNTLDNVKSPAIQAQINSLLGSYSTNTASGASALADYIKQYTGGNAAAAANTGQEIGSVDRYYNGAVDSTLAGMRANANNAYLTAANRSSQAALAGIHGNMLAGQGGGSSYDSRLALQSYGNYATQAALQNAAQTRSDYGFLLGQQQANLGTRNRLADALAGRALVPYQAGQGIFQNNLSNLGSIQSMNNANNFYGLQQNKTLGDQFAQFANAADTGIMNGLSIAGSLAGGMGGLGGMMGMGGSKSPSTSPGTGGGGGGGGSTDFNAQTNEANAPYNAADWSTGATPTIGTGSYPAFQQPYGYGYNPGDPYGYGLGPGFGGP